MEDKNSLQGTLACKLQIWWNAGGHPGIFGIMHLVLRDIIPFSDILNGAISTGSFLCSLAALEIVEQSFLQDTVNQTGKLNVSTVYYYVFFSENDNQDRFNLITWPTFVTSRVQRVSQTSQTSDIEIQNVCFAVFDHPREIKEPQ